MFARLRDLSIKRKLTLIITLTSALALTLACAGFVLQDVATFREDLVENTSALATIIGQNTVAALTFNDPVAATDALGTLGSQPHVVNAVLYTADGRPFAHYRRAGAAAELPASQAIADVALFGPNRLQLARVVRINGESLGLLWLSTDLGALTGRLHRYYAIAAALLLAATLAAFVLSAGFQRVISRPLTELVGLARQVSAQKDYSVRAVPRGRDEIGVALEGFNAMLEQIQTRDAALQAARDDLEHRVQERTRELQRQIGERLAAEKALQQQLTRISLLNQITTAISSRQDLDSIAQIVLAEIEAHLPADFGSLSLHDPVAGTLAVAAMRRRGVTTAPLTEALAPRGPLATALTGLENCRVGEQVYWPDTARVSSALAGQFAAAGLGSVVAVPLMLERRLFGVLVVARREPDAFAGGESEFLRVLGEQVALAGAQARLYTELQCAYTELRQSQQTVMQQERLRALGQMASGIAHDINNTLSPIVAFADILLVQEETLTADGRRQLGYILTAGEDIGKIVQRLREFSRPRASHEKHTIVDLNALLRQVAELTRPRWRDMPQARGVDLRLQTDLAAGLPPVAGLEAELREAVINLVLNAVDAMPAGGTLTLRTRVFYGGVAAEISDSGVGMDEETKKRCFEPFFSTKGQLGTGLGLAMVYGVMERHQGRIEVDSAPGAGTTMRLVFPGRPAGEAAVASPAVRAGGPPRLRLLCIDDEPSLRVVMKQLLEFDGHAVETADGGAGGLELLRQAAAAGRPFDIVITDLGMPNMDGRQVALAVKRESPRTGVVLLTGWGTIIQDNEGLPPGVDVVLGKPPRRQELIDTLTRVAANRPPAAPV